MEHGGRKAEPAGRQSEAGRSLAEQTAALKARLDQLYTAFDLEHVVADPIWIVRRFRHPADREVVAFCAAALAFGRVQGVLNAIEALVRVMGPRPAEYVRRFEPEVHGAAVFPLVHRWARGVDLVALLWLLRQMIARGGSIEGFFAEGMHPDALTVVDALESFSTRAMALDLCEVYGTVPARPGVAYFFSRPRPAAPASGSTCSSGGWSGSIASTSASWSRVRPSRSSSRSTRTSSASGDASA